MAFLSALGDWLDESGWVKRLSNASVANSGIAESFLSGSKVSKSRYAHQVTGNYARWLPVHLYDMRTF